MPSRLSKVQKHITKKKGKNASLHENSRDTKRLQRASGRDDKLNRLTTMREKQNRPYLIRVKHFQTCCQDHDLAFPIDEIQAFISQYLARDDDELATLQAERRAGRPPSTRETLLKQNQVTEQGEYTSGFWLPDLQDVDNVKMLKEWDGKWASLGQLKFARVAKDGHARESIFPPKGLS
ncbi:hypothetical protein P154DRAFT_522071 [Amniculicola lignicola CBS 123094]|uniref:Translation machinery-associated protein 16 n=1 Tax=Amniculicola lignicola CBS 123094 TaxID=1392246 RepID=A0A6A5WI23_9PLEO|nr:hypothetical protein P154DRAFT_522071 [Amniculicola lignicola CBS 123094]